MFPGRASGASNGQCPPGRASEASNGPCHAESLKPHDLQSIAHGARPPPPPPPGHPHPPPPHLPPPPPPRRRRGGTHRPPRRQHRKITAFHGRRKADPGARIGRQPR